MKLKNMLFLTVFVWLFAALLCAGILCACMDNGEDNASEIITVPESTSVEGDVNTDSYLGEYELERVIYQSYYSDLFGYKIVGYNNAGGKEQHLLYHTSDGGSTWDKIDTNIDTVCPQMVTGICFSNKSVGIVTFRHRSFDFNPAIVWTVDGGMTWVRATNICELLSEYTKQGYMLEAATSFFEDGICHFKITAIRHDESSDDIIELEIMSTDFNTWKLCEKLC